MKISKSTLKLVGIGVLALGLFHLLFTYTFSGQNSVFNPDTDSFEAPGVDMAFDHDSVRVLDSKVAWAIPVGGRTRRVDVLARLLDDLLSQGAGRHNIYVFEDNGSRDFISDPDLEIVCKRYGVHLLRSSIKRLNTAYDKTRKAFGNYLAMHYYFMMNYVLEDRAKFHDYIAIIEDDLVLAPDAVKYFTTMSHVMAIDDSVYCVSAHADNSFPVLATEGTHKEGLKLMEFDFRRGNHFMAPGWMTSRDLYTKVLKPKWFDADGSLPYQEELGMGNSNWDMFMEVMIGERECIFPEVPRISHRGGGGFTVSKAQQLILFGNLQLATIPATTPYPDNIVQSLTKEGYDTLIDVFIDGAQVITDIRQAATFRESKLVLLIPAKHPAHSEWVTLFSGFFGVTAVGGHAGHGKQRAIHEMTVFVSYYGNDILVMGTTSKFLTEDPVPDHLTAGLREMRAAMTSANEQLAELAYHGCFRDRMGTADGRDLPFAVSIARASPAVCVAACNDQGFLYGAVQNSVECWCGNEYGKFGRANKDSDCVACSGLESVKCGGPLRNSVYSSSVEANQVIQNTFVHPTDLRHEYAARAGTTSQSCTQVCSAAGQMCDVSLFPLLLDLKQMKKLGCKSATAANDIDGQFAAPAFNPMTGQCTTTSNRFISCGYTPKDESILRLCPCVSDGIST